jgi:hypothetical protein
LTLREPAFDDQTGSGIFPIASQPKFVRFGQLRPALFKKPISSRVKRHNRVVYNWLNFLVIVLARHAPNTERAAQMAAPKKLLTSGF